MSRRVMLHQTLHWLEKFQRASKRVSERCPVVVGRIMSRLFDEMMRRCSGASHFPTCSLLHFNDSVVSVLVMSLKVMMMTWTLAQVNSQYVEWLGVRGGHSSSWNVFCYRSWEWSDWASSDGVVPFGLSDVIDDVKRLAQPTALSSGSPI